MGRRPLAAAQRDSARALKEAEPLANAELPNLSLAQALLPHTYRIRTTRLDHNDPTNVCIILAAAAAVRVRARLQLNNGCAARHLLGAVRCVTPAKREKFAPRIGSGFANLRNDNAPRHDVVISRDEHGSGRDDYNEYRGEPES